MKIVLILGLLPLLASAHNKIVYGSDNRKEVYESAVKLQKLAESTAGMIRTSSLSLNLISTTYSYNYSTLNQGEILCPSQRFGEQPTLPICSGFLIAPDLLVTAGHCMDSEDSCSSFSWVFDYKLANSTSRFPSIKMQDVYKCKQIIKYEKDDYMDKDYAIIKLDRKVLNRKPLKLALENVQAGDQLVMIGHPSGLPTKVTDNAQVLRLQLDSFKTNLDAFHGNSGSAVFDAQTLEVVGILVRGAKDYNMVTENARTCSAVNVKPDYAGGESVSHISQIFNALMQYEYQQVIR
jgi:V8-like Glu-specific endopeptidase